MKNIIQNKIAISSKQEKLVSVITIVDAIKDKANVVIIFNEYEIL